MPETRFSIRSTPHPAPRLGSRAGRADRRMACQGRFSNVTMRNPGTIRRSGPARLRSQWAGVWVRGMAPRSGLGVAVRAPCRRLCLLRPPQGLTTEDTKGHGGPRRRGGFVGGMGFGDGVGGGGFKSNCGEAVYPAPAPPIPPTAPAAPQRLRGSSWPFVSSVVKPCGQRHKRNEGPWDFQWRGLALNAGPPPGWPTQSQNRQRRGPACPSTWWLDPPKPPSRHHTDTSSRRSSTRAARWSAPIMATRSGRLGIGFFCSHQLAATIGGRQGPPIVSIPSGRSVSCRTFCPGCLRVCTIMPMS